MHPLRGGGGVNGRPILFSWLHMNKMSFSSCNCSLEWRPGSTAQILSDLDLTSQRDGRWKRINTLMHYNVRKHFSPIVNIFWLLFTSMWLSVKAIWLGLLCLRKSELITLLPFKDQTGNIKSSKNAEEAVLVSCSPDKHSDSNTFNFEEHKACFLLFNEYQVPF